MERLGVLQLVGLWLVEPLRDSPPKDCQCHHQKWCLMSNHSGGNGVVRDLALQQHGYACACHGIGRKLVRGMSLLMLQRVAVRVGKKVETHQSRLLKRSVRGMDRRLWLRRDRVWDRLSIPMGQECAFSSVRNELFDLCLIRRHVHLEGLK